MLASWKKAMTNLAAAKSLQSCLTLCEPIDSSPPGSAVPGILQARALEWAATSFSNAPAVNEEFKKRNSVEFFYGEFKS